MAHDEGPIDKLRVRNIILAPTQTGQVQGTAGRMFLSGGKIWFDTGSALQIVTSA